MASFASSMPAVNFPLASMSIGHPSTFPFGSSGHHATSLNRCSPALILPFPSRQPGSAATRIVRCSARHHQHHHHHPQNQELKRTDFPNDFQFGVGTSAFQIEGAPTAGGRGTTIWDSFVHIPDRIANGAINYPGCDFFYLYEEDIKLVKELGFNAFRFSISWTRIFPNGTVSESPEGIAFYNKLINAIVKAGLTPFATLFHWEVPQYLENDPKILGWRTRNIVPHFVKLAETCFINFGDRVKMWATINEMNIFSIHGYGYGRFAPGRCTPSLAQNENCLAGDSRTEPYLVGHHLLLAHAKVYNLYKNCYKEEQKGVCGFNPNHFGVEPYSSLLEDVDATERYLEFNTGWQLDPVVFGRYPQKMINVLGDRLPTFTKEESEELNNSFDFLGVNYYTATFIQNSKVPNDPMQRWIKNDGGYATHDQNVDGVFIGEHMGPKDSYIYNCPAQLIKLLEWMNNRYGNIPWYITENGVMDKNPDNEIDALDDTQRCKYIYDHLTYLSKAIKEKGYNVKGYYNWAYCDNFEWSSGYTVRYGIVRVDYESRKRIPKNSAKWFKKFLQN